MEKFDWTRREFLKTTTAATAAAGLGIDVLARGVLAEPDPRIGRSVSANDKIVVGLIGCGGMGMSNLRNLMSYPDVEVAALCDVDSNRIKNDFDEVESKKGYRPQVFEDYRKMLENKDINVIIVGTPDHWHALNLIHACEAGKDVYCEKPVSYSITESKAMVAAQRRFKRVVQVGTWQRSTREFHDAIEFIRAGKLGRIVACHCWIDDNQRIGRGRVQPVPSGLNYDMWIGPAAMTPYQENKTHFNWRWVRNIGGGKTTDWGVHMIDIALLGMSKGQDLVMPSTISAVGGRLAVQNDDRDYPDTVEAVLKFNDPEFVMTWSVLRDLRGRPHNGTEFVSEDGRVLRVYRGGWQVLGPDGKELPKESAEPLDSNHWLNFLDCVRSRERPRADLASVAQTTDVCHLINASLYSGEMVRYDKTKNDIVGEAGKDTSAYQRAYRKGYRLRMH